MYNKLLSILTKRTSMVTFNLDRAHRMVHIKLSKKYIFGFKTETELHFTYFEYKLFAGIVLHGNTSNLIKTPHILYRIPQANAILKLQKRNMEGVFYEKTAWLSEGR